MSSGLPIFDLFGALHCTVVIAKWIWASLNARSSVGAI
jgi:hypothetical protein